MMTAATLAFAPVNLIEDKSRAARRKDVPDNGPDALTSVELLARAQAGDEIALNDLCARYGPRLQRWAHGRLPAYARGALDTQDIVQETLIRAVQRLDSFVPRHDGAVGAFLRRTRMNLVLDQIRSAQRRPTDLIDSAHPDAGPSPFDEAVGTETRERYERALDSLNDPYRAAIILRIELRLPYPEVARELGQTVETAYVTVSRALVKLAEEMARDKRS